MASRLYQGIVYQMKGAIGRLIGVIDAEGAVVACSELSLIGDLRADAVAEVFGRDDSAIVVDGCTYRTIGHPGGTGDCAVFVEGADAEAERFTAVLSIALENLRQYYDEKFDKGNFVKNVVLENVLPGDVYAKARELRLADDVRRVVLLVRIVSGGENNAAYEIVSGLFNDDQKDFVFSISERDIVIVKEIGPDIDAEAVEALAASIADALEGERYIRSSVGIGTIVQGIKDLPESFKNAQVALEVGKVFDSEHTILSYNNLGIARLIYQLPTTVCEMFLKEVFKKGSADSLDEETLFTIQRFFENNLNVSETSRGLFVHRNTLVYRIDKIKKLTGLDLREFDDAIVFKVALMVKKYLHSDNTVY